MVQTFFERSFAINRLRQGPLAGHIDLLAARLATLGYSRVHSRIQLRLVGHFNRWLEQKNLTVEHIDEEIIERYWRYFMRKKRVRSKDVCALVKLLDLLREQGVTPRRTIEAVPTARETLLEKYRCYLHEERDLAYGLTTAKMKDCRWLKPVLPGQFEFVEWTLDKHLRHSRFMR